MTETTELKPLKNETADKGGTTVICSRLRERWKKQPCYNGRYWVFDVYMKAMSENPTIVYTISFNTWYI